MPQIKEREDVQRHIQKACDIYKHYSMPRPNKIHTAIRYLDVMAKGEEKGEYCCPTPTEVDDADIVQFEWLPLLEIDDRRLLWKRFSGMGWKRLATEHNICEKTARNRVKKSIDKLYELLH